ncbi:MAG: hypothetical protein K1X88_36230, partial [Nannocystaceae bacterium]|nr:hypothetical protein [Nannocystaceae bacterium]
MTRARLLAITPPHGAIAADAIDRWHDAGAAGLLALWLRTPAAAPSAVLERCGAIVARARDLGVPVLLGIDADALAAARALWAGLEIG